MDMFKFDAKGQYLMPAHFGEWDQRSWGNLVYHDVTTIAVSYLTDGDKAKKFLPAPFEMDEEPIITVTSCMNRKCDFLAGRGYNLVLVGLSAVYNSTEETIRSLFIIVIWENLTDPIIIGRELLGTPKIYADIPDHQETKGGWHSTASNFGHKIVDMSVEELTEIPAENIEAMNKDKKYGEKVYFGWQYLPAAGHKGTPVSYPTLFPKKSTIKQAWNGKGNIQWYHATWEQNPTQFHIVNPLADLPVLEMREAFVTKSATDIDVVERPVRRLKEPKGVAF